MSITALSSIITLPEKCPLQEVQGVMSECYEIKDFNGKNKQDFKLKDASGNLVKATAWAHDDLSFYKGKDIIIKAGPKGGLTVNNYQGKPGISVSSTCTFQSIAGVAAPSPQPAAQGSSNATQSASTAHHTPHVRPVIQGQTIGMAINNACQSLTAQGQPLTKGSVWKLASMIVGVAQAMEAGKIYEEPKAAAPAPKQEEDVPYTEPQDTNPF